MTNWALVVGINQYDGLPAANRLFGAVADAVDFAEWVLHPQGGAVDPAQFFMWTYPAPAADGHGPLGLMSLSAKWARADGPLATRAPAVNDIVAMVLELQNRVATAPGPHRIYVFFAGHGTQVAGADGETCFVVGDFEGIGNLGIIPCDALRASLETNGFTEVVMFLDCCRSPLNLRDKAPNYFAEGGQDQQFRAVGRATQRGQQAFEFPAQPPKRGAFTKAVTEGLRRKRDDQNNLTLDDLEAYVRGRVTGLLGAGKQSPKFESEPDPWGKPLISGPPIEILADIIVHDAPPGAQLQLYDASNAPFGAPAPEAGGLVRFPSVPTANSYSVGIVGGDILKSFRHPGPDDTDVPLSGGADVGP